MATKPKDRREENRLRRLSALFLRIREKHLRGAKLKREIRRAAWRWLKGRSRRYSVSSLYRLYYAWLKSPTTDTLRRKYNSPPKSRIPAPILAELIRRVAERTDLSANGGRASLIEALGRGVRVPNLGKPTAASLQGTPGATRIPSNATLRRSLGPEFPELRRNALKGRRAIAKLDAYLAQRIRELERAQ